MVAPEGRVTENRKLRMPESATESFFDVNRLLASSVPRARGSWGWYGAGVFLLILMLTSYLSGQFPQVQKAIEGFSTLALIAVMGAVIAVSWAAARAMQREQFQLESVEELMQLRRWGEAAALLQTLFSSPMRSVHARLQGLLYLASVLGRYHRFADAIAVYDHILDTMNLDEEGVYGIKMARAMSQLRDDRLFDVDRAINELRRVRGAEESAGLALVEIYRDVKTGHPQEAADLFEQRRSVIRKQLGVRVADAIALAARAHDMLGHGEQAGALYDQATLLVPEAELARRYPEVAPLIGKYRAAAAPQEAA